MDPHQAVKPGPLLTEYREARAAWQAFDIEADRRVARALVALDRSNEFIPYDVYLNGEHVESVWEDNVTAVAYSYFSRAYDTLKPGDVFRVEASDFPTILTHRAEVVIRHDKLAYSYVGGSGVRDHVDESLL